MVAIFVLSAFVLVLMVDHLVLKLQGRTHPAFEPISAPIGFAELPDINHPLASNIFLSKGHTWLKKNREGLIEVGVDLFGSRALGGLVLTKCSEVNTVVKRGDVLFAGNYGAEPVEFLSPIDGTIKQINPKILDGKILNPYETWGIKVNSNDNINLKKELFSGKNAVEWLKTEFEKLKLFLEKHDANLVLVGETMFDGGASSANLSITPTKIIVNNFKTEFLSL